MKRMNLVLGIALLASLSTLHFSQTGGENDATTELDVRQHQEECARLAEATGADINLISFGGRDCGDRPTSSAFAWSEN